MPIADGQTYFLDPPLGEESELIRRYRGARVLVLRTFPSTPGFGVVIRTLDEAAQGLVPESWLRPILPPPTLGRGLGL